MLRRGDVPCRRACSPPSFSPLPGRLACFPPSSARSRADEPYSPPSFSPLPDRRGVLPAVIRPFLDCRGAELRPDGPSAACAGGKKIPGSSQARDCPDGVVVRCVPLRLFRGPGAALSAAPVARGRSAAPFPPLQRQRSGCGVRLRNARPERQPAGSPPCGRCRPRSARRG